MSGGMAMFQSELRTAVREARDAPALQTKAQPVPRLAVRPGPRGELTDRFPRTPRASEKRTVVKLWLPLTPLWILLAPFALLACPLLALAPATRGVPPLRAALAVGAVLISLSGTQVDVDTPRALVRIRFF